MSAAALPHSPNAASPARGQHQNSMSSEAMAAVQHSLTLVGEAEGLQVWRPDGAAGVSLPHRPLVPTTQQVAEPVVDVQADEQPQRRSRGRGASSVLFAAFVAIQRIGRRKSSDDETN